MNEWARKSATNFVRAKSLKALESSNFRFYLIGQAISSMGTGFQQVALAWLVYRVTHSASALAAMTAFLLTGQLIFSFYGGCLADKMDRRHLLIVLQWLGILVSVSIAGSIFLNWINLPIILVLAFVVGAFAALEYPARQSLTSDLVAPEHQLNARGLYSCICASFIALGQSSAGFLIDSLPAIGEACCALLNACSFVFSLLMLKHVVGKARVIGTTDGDGQNGKSQANNNGVLIGNRDCLNFVFRSDAILITLIQTAVLVLFGLRYLSLLPAFSAEVFNGGARESGILTATVAIGFALGGLLCGLQNKKERLELWVDLSLVLLPLAMLVFCHANFLQLAIVSVLFMSICQSVNANSSIALLQANSPDRLFGRLMGMRITVIAAADLIAALVVFFVLNNIGLRTTVMSAAFLCFIAAVLIFSRRALSWRSASVPQPVEVYQRNIE